MPQPSDQSSSWALEWPAAILGHLLSWQKFHSDPQGRQITMTLHPLRKFQGLNTLHIPKPGTKASQILQQLTKYLRFLRHQFLCRKDHEQGPSLVWAIFPFHFLTFHDRNVQAYAMVGRIRKWAPGSHLCLLVTQSSSGTYFSSMFCPGTTLKLTPHTLSLSIFYPKFPEIVTTLW